MLRLRNRNLERVRSITAHLQTASVELMTRNKRPMMILPLKRLLVAETRSNRSATVHWRLKAC